MKLILLLILAGCVTPLQDCKRQQEKVYRDRVQCRIEIRDQIASEGMTPKNLEPFVDEVCLKQKPDAECWK